MLETENKSILSETNEHPLLLGLNAEQREAVVSEHKRLLVLAGAGSGKTKTLIQRILYLISEKKVEPASILAVTFTRNAGQEMIDRIILSTDNEGTYAAIVHDKTLSDRIKETERRKYIRKYPWLSAMAVQTFHSFCYGLLRKFGSPAFDNRFKLLSDSSPEEDVDSELRAPETQKEIFQKLIKQQCENAEYLLKLKRYILDYYVDEPRRKTAREGQTLYEKPYTTLRGEQVRSKSERYIADWLYLHQIEYAYEPTVVLQDFPFQPDFYLPQADLYLEHVSNLSQGMKDKEEQFHIARKLFIKTYEPMTRDIGEFYDALARSILPRITESIRCDVALSVESEFKMYFKQLDEFVSMLITMMDKIKVEGVSFEEVYRKASNEQFDRVKVFYELAKPLLDAYMEYCTRKSYLDFNDLLILALQLLERSEETRDMFREKYQHILVDEFQDVNTLQIRLLHQLLHDETNLFCVGDDWQSIYGWRGAEVDYIVNFTQHFQDARIIKLSVNYRSNDTIVRASNEVIKKNMHKIDKEIRALKQEGKKIYLYLAQKEAEDGVANVVNAVLELLKKGYRREDILVLYRKSRAIEPYREHLRGPVTLRTIHAAKGLEAKIVFIVGLTGGVYGFPQVWESDRILQLIKPRNVRVLMEEERRLMYVALTRAREEVFLISEVGNESSFIKEIPSELVERSTFISLGAGNAGKQCAACKFELAGEFRFCPHCGEGVKA